ncbi:hypothetical protein CRUP_034644, partial [Coryphaenoides rupestris]
TGDSGQPGEAGPNGVDGLSGTKGDIGDTGKSESLDPRDRLDDGVRPAWRASSERRAPWEPRGILGNPAPRG